jgi:hypothetical protein
MYPGTDFRMTGCVWQKNRLKCRPTQRFVKNNALILPCKKEAQNLSCFCNFQKATQCKQVPKRRKFDQSGHPYSFRCTFNFDIIRKETTRGQGDQMSL